MAWIPAITTTSLFAAGLWLARNLISTRLTKRVEHEFNEKLEKTRADYRRGEDELRAVLQARAAEIEALRAGALATMSTRQAAIDKRRLEGVDQVWASVMALGQVRVLAASLSAIRVDVIGEMAGRDEKVLRFVEMLGFGFDPKKLDHASAAKARPFVSPMVWAVYSAMQAVASHAVIQWHALKNGVNPNGLLDEGKIKNLIKVALPHYGDYIDKHGAEAFYYTLDALEAQLLVEIQKMLNGAEDDKASMDRAADILRHSKELMRVAATATPAA
ncbi:hypothetical protein ACXU4B_10245 [Dyella soli]|uniref:Uncharacterized protein n=1 Tax=Dyella soli TaxID=522319 RepID=A0A4R0YT95_9GAMM|nr:hypothetical protein [Dyella soli]TCI11305.1 hypothetical protein EZM97_21135 [Dyella soli]